MREDSKNVCFCKKCAVCGSVDPLCIFSKFYNCAIWAMTVGLLLGLWLWLAMRVNLGLIFYAAWLFLFVVFCLIRKLRFGWKFTAINVAVCAVFNLVVFGVNKLSSLPAVRIREGLGRKWHLGTVSAIWYGYLIAGLVLILVVGILRDKKKAKV